MIEDMFSTRLSNGLRVQLKELHKAPIISSWIWYGVGSRDERSGKTGLSHWVEHMQFKGTDRFPSGKLDRMVSRVGGVWNAFTYLDWTTYYETLPKQSIGLAFKLEADRMIHSRFTPLDVESERSVIISEREGNENEPLFRLGEAVQKAAFRKHPYRHEVIGEKRDLRAIGREDLFKHYQHFYTPSNALLAVAGDFKIDKILRSIDSVFGSIPSRPFLKSKVETEPIPIEEKRVMVHGPGETAYLQIAFRAPGGNSADFMNLTVIDSLLAGPTGLNMFGGGSISNKTSRLYRALVEKEFAVGVGGGIQATIDPFLYVITITVNPRHTPDEALVAFDQEIQRLLNQPVTPKEVRQAIKQARALFAYGSESITNQAFWLGYSEMFADYTWFDSYLDRISSVTPQSALDCCQHYLRDSTRVVGYYVPAGKGNA